MIWDILNLIFVGIATLVIIVDFIDRKVENKRRPNGKDERR